MAIAGGVCQAQGLAPAPPAAQATPPPSRWPFNRNLYRPFLEAARAAEQISDPLQRCLAYPDLPGVNWTKAVTAAYCHYQFDPVVSLAEARDLIEHGKAAELDRRLGKARPAPLSTLGAHDRLEGTYFTDFDDGSDDLRALLDAWKKQSPHSAYALAASGMAYAAMAQKQRGAEVASRTSPASFEAMSRLLTLARADLDEAIKRDPKVTPAYSSMIYVAGLEGDRAYAAHAGEQGLANDPANYSIYANLVWINQPKWGGSVEAMQRLVSDAQAHADQNPLLRLLLSQRTGGDEAIEDCNCVRVDDPRASPTAQKDFYAAAKNVYQQLFDEAAPRLMLRSAAVSTRNHHALPLSLIYRSEEIRFSRDAIEPRILRALDLADSGQQEWALAEGKALVSLRPQDPDAYVARGMAYRASGDVKQAADDLEEAVRRNPSDGWTLNALCHLYVDETHDWDKGWAATNKLLQLRPDSASGWFYRATIQKEQPREGLDQTIADFMAKFGGDPNKQELVAHMQAMKQR
ncbi:hypothetical protein HY57_07535 [Dyella japonica A8]|uniref:Uncharacterized protein n=2 Tax=Dyella japonica TaxID=231455 RepID=A0A075JZZ7_9GAMM|nr:hypothetical protein HY57_07535 [Dyella japonica A8]